MADTRIVAPSGGGMKCTVSGTEITFPTGVRGPSGGYTNSHFIVNLTKAAAKQMATVTVESGHVDSITKCTVAAIDSWVDTDRYALALTSQPTFVYGTIAAMIAAAQAGDEGVVYPQNARGDMRYSERLNPGKDGLIIRSYSAKRKYLVFSMGISNSVEIYDAETDRVHTSGSAIVYVNAAGKDVGHSPAAIVDSGKVKQGSPGEPYGRGARERAPSAGRGPRRPEACPAFISTIMIDRQKRGK